jgi:hypothetical protein
MKKVANFIVFVLILILVIVLISESNKSDVSPKKNKKENEKNVLEKQDSKYPILNKDITLSKRKEIYYELVKLQDKVNPSSDLANEHYKNSKELIRTINEITEEQLTEIIIEGTHKNWPIPPSPKRK